MDNVSNESNTSKSVLKCLLFNAQSLCNKLCDLDYLLSSDRPDIVFITETWLTSDISNSLLDKYNEYNVYRVDRDRRGGGVAIFCHRSLYSVQVFVNVSFLSLEVINLRVSYGSTTFNFINVYRPPGVDDQSKIYMSTLIDFLRQACSSKLFNILVGDFNLPGIDWLSGICPDDDIHSSFYDVVSELGLTQCVNHATRNNNLLDLVFTDNPLIMSNIDVQCPFSHSDHSSVAFDILLPSKSCVKEDLCDCFNDYFYDFKNADYGSIRDALAMYDWNVLLDNCSNVESAWAIFINVINDAVAANVPLKSARKIPVSRKSTYPKYIMRMMQKKKRLWRKHRAHRTAESKQQYQCMSKLCRTEIHNNRILHEREIISSNNLGRFYKYVNSKLYDSSGISSLKDDNGLLVTDDHARANLLNDFFCSVGVVDDGLSPVFADRSCSAGSALTLVTFTPQSVYKQLRSLKTNTAAGPDRLSPALLKELAFVISSPLAKIFNLSMSTGELPSIWKRATVTPVFKGGASSDPGNYRPISLTSICCKVMESIIKAELLAYLLKHKLITKQQHGFLAKRSTITNLVDCLNDWTLSIKNSKSVNVAYIDYRKAFDTVSHSKLLIKLRGYGIVDSLLRWIAAYLLNRTQVVCVNGHLSNCRNLISGVPQGSVLGPILFLLFINDVVDIFSPGIMAKLFADDLKLYCEIETSDDVSLLQSDLFKLEEWSAVWQLTISVKKCNILYVGNKIRSDLVYSLCNTSMPCVSVVRDLGIFVDSRLKFDAHINSIVARAHQRANCIYRCFLSKDVDWLIKAFTSYVRPLVEYASPIWNPTTVALIGKIERVQRKYTKRLPGFRSLTYGQRLAKINLQSLEYRRLVADLLLCFKIVHNLVDVTFSDLFHVHNNSITRGHSYKLMQQHCRINARAHFFVNRVTPVWNSLPDFVVSADGLNVFKKRLNECNLEKYYLHHE